MMATSSGSKDVTPSVTVSDLSPGYNDDTNDPHDFREYKQLMGTAKIGILQSSHINIIT